MLASEPIAALVPFEEQLAEKREFYSTAISDTLDFVLEDVILAGDRTMLLQDAAMFMVFLLATKIAAAAGAEATDRKAVLAAYWPLEKAIKAEIPGMLMQFVDAAKAVEPQGEC
ncbi:MAG: hypothetical protein H0U66_09665 [Gemmatimonadaceae bacterium]|nr:hypothetical protein [Gemmatimonadaceae bacterium]